MDQNFTRIAIILDRSGSMESMQEATVSGFNEFVGKLKAGQGVVKLKLVQFDHEYETVFDLPLQEVPVLTAAMFVPRGTTALLDAMGRTIGALGEELADMPEAERPARVIVMTMTDGLENASQYYTRAQMAAMVAHQQAVYSWQFMYLGANQDAIGVAADLGISGAASMNYKANRRAVAATFSACASAVDQFACCLSDSLSFSLDHREAAMTEEEELAPGSSTDQEAMTAGVV
jgi:hypothetical protein